MRTYRRGFVAVNRRISRRIGARLPQKKEDAQEIYLRAMAERLAALPPSATVVDIGGGRHCHFAAFRPPGSQIRIVAVDVSREELAANADVDETKIADVTRGLPFESGSVDVVASEAVLEHLTDIESFIVDSARVTKPGGLFISLFSSRFSPHAIANRMLPEAWSSRLLRTLVPGSGGRLGFEAYYDRTYPAEVRRLLEEHGFSVSCVRVSYYQSPYLEFFVPFFLLSAVYELCIRALGVENLAAYVVVAAERRQS